MLSSFAYIKIGNRNESLSEGTMYLPKNGSQVYLS